MRLGCIGLAHAELEGAVTARPGHTLTLLRRGERLHVPIVLGEGGG